jgi:hypothetical protein
MAMSATWTDRMTSTRGMVNPAPPCRRTGHLPAPLEGFGRAQRRKAFPENAPAVQKSEACATERFIPSIPIGLGKSTSALLLATFLAKLYDVTVIDADPNHPIRDWADGGQCPGASDRRLGG